MTKQNSELEQDLKKKLIQKYLQKLVSEDPTLYYSSTADIARALHPMLIEHKNRMSVEEQALIKNLSARDIEMLLSFR